MELVRELFATALVAVFFSFVIAKLVSFATAGSSHSVSNNIDQDIVPDVNDDDKEEDVIMEELQFCQKFQVGETVTDSNEIESNETVARKIDEFMGEEIGSVENLIAEEVKKGLEEIVIETVRKSEMVEKESEVAIESDEDWEGIERSELEKMFAEAARLVESEDNKEKFTAKTEAELYGLNKVVTEGPCRHHPPMPLKLSARAKCDGGPWFHCARNAWQKLGNLSPEAAMEQYIAIVSDTIPGWMEDKSIGGDNLGSSEAVDHGAVDSDLCTSSSAESEVINERVAELKTADKDLI